MPARRRKGSSLLAPATTRIPDDVDFEPNVRARQDGLSWILETLERDPSFVHRRMFGCEAAYLGGLICLVTAGKREPWNGLLVCTSIDRHSALLEEWPALAPHRVLGKWLYISQDHPDFERVARAVTRRVLDRDPRIGVEPKPRKKRKAKRTRRLA